MYKYVRLNVYYVNVLRMYTGLVLAYYYIHTETYLYVGMYVQVCEIECTSMYTGMHGSCIYTTLHNTTIYTLRHTCT